MSIVIDSLVHPSRQLNLRSFWGQPRQTTPSAFWLASSVALLIGTFQGLLQVFPATAYFLTTPEEVPNIHAQFILKARPKFKKIGNKAFSTPF
jgi:hypothetical protein